jgi:hypothetical protein
MKCYLKRWTSLLAILFLFAPLFIQAQTTGTLRGFVRDDKGEPLPGVAIEVESESMMTPKATVTDAKGYYRFLYLPPGTYTICAKLEGFEVCWVRGVSVQVQKTYTADITMNQGTLEETIEVTAEAPVIDTESASKSYNINIEMIATVPIAPRMNFSDVWQTLPGVSGGWGDSPLVNAGHITRNLEPGKSYFWSQHNQDDSYENKIKIDGMEINDSMSGTSYAMFNYESIQEIDVKTAGATAEYGNARSAFMNVVTKSGGNVLTGSLLFQYQPESFNTTNIEGGSAAKTSYAVPAITLSGPILKDKIWFLASYRYNNENYVYPNTIVESKIVRENRSHMPFVKLTFQPHPNHTFTAVYQNDYTEIAHGAFPSTTYGTIATAQTNKQGGPMFSGTWRWIISNNLYFNFVAGYNHKPRDNWADSENPRYQYTERAQGGSTLKYDSGYGEDYYSIRENLMFGADLTHFADDLWGTGAHEIKLGVEVRPYQHVTRTRKYWVDQYGFYQYRFGLDYANYGLSEPYVYRGYATKGAPGLPQDRYDNEVMVTNQNVYLQDSWVVSNSLTLHLGLRWEHQREDMYYRDLLPAWMDEIYSGMRDNIEFDDSGFAPRLGLTYNWGGIGVFKFHFGRYFEYVGTGDYNNYATTMVFPEYRMATADIGKGPEALKPYTDPELSYPADYNKDMKMEFNDEFVVSFEREIGWNLAFDTTFVYRNIHMSNMEDVNAIFQDGKFVDRKFPAYNTIWMRTWYDPPRWKFFYKGLQFNVKRNFTGRWGFLANYSLMWRTYRRTQWDPGNPEQFIYPNPSSLDMENYGRRWAFHVSAFYRLPWDIMVATYINGNDGIWIADTTGDYAWDQSAPLVTLSNGRRVSDIVWQAANDFYTGKQWGSTGRRTDPLWMVNLRFSKGLNISRLRFELALDVFNIFNWCAYSSWETNDIRRDYVDSSGINRYLRQLSPQSPRAAQLSLNVRF